MMNKTTQEDLLDELEEANTLEDLKAVMYKFIREQNLTPKKIRGVHKTT